MQACCKVTRICRHYRLTSEGLLLIHMACHISFANLSEYHIVILIYKKMNLTITFTRERLISVVSMEPKIVIGIVLSKKICIPALRSILVQFLNFFVTWSMRSAFDIAQ